MKERTTWRSERLGGEVTVVRWGVMGRPVLVFPTAGGDAEEIERFHLVGALRELLGDGRIKVYSVDSVAGRVLAQGEGTPRQRGAMVDRYQEFVFHEVVPAIRADCRSGDVEVVAAGASIGAFNALCMVVRYPQVFSHALCLSGTYDLSRFFRDGDPGPEFRVASPLDGGLARLSDEHLARLRERFVLLASGEGRNEDIGESWRVAHALGAKGIPNRVDSWGTDRDHDWPLWREMLPRYVADVVPTAG